MKKLNLTQDKAIQVGIDIGTSKICCSIAEYSGDVDKIKLLGIGTSVSTGINRGSIIHHDKFIDEMEQAITAAETMAGLKVEHVWVSVSGTHIRGINHQGASHMRDKGLGAEEHPITKTDVKKVMDYAKSVNFPVDREILHILPQEFIVDTLTGIKDPVGMTGRRLEARVHLVTATTSSLSNIINCVEELGVIVDGIVFQGLASGLSTLEQDERDLGIALVDIGAGTTDIVIYSGGGIRHTAVIPIGAASVTNDIAVMLQISKKEAENIKIKYASAIASKASPELDFVLPDKVSDLSRKITEHELSRYVEARMIEILQMIQRELVRANVQDSLAYGVVLTGGGAQLKNIKGLAEEILKCRIRIATPIGLHGAIDLVDHPCYAASMGLVQWAYHDEEIRLKRNGHISVKDILSKIKNIFTLKP